jgi:hypothetical protein
MTNAQRATYGRRRVWLNQKVSVGHWGYANGDFTYDGVFDGGDYGIIDTNIQAQGAPFPTDAPALAGVTAVPEPSAASLLLLLAWPLAPLGRRRRRLQR